MIYLLTKIIKKGLSLRYEKGYTFVSVWILPVILWLRKMYYTL
jgi:hypothetical protein